VLESILKFVSHLRDIHDFVPAMLMREVEISLKFFLRAAPTLQIIFLENLMLSLLFIAGVHYLMNLRMVLGAAVMLNNIARQFFTFLNLSVFMNFSLPCPLNKLNIKVTREGTELFFDLSRKFYFTVF